MLAPAFKLWVGVNNVGEDVAETPEQTKALRKEVWQWWGRAGRWYSAYRSNKTKGMDSSAKESAGNYLIIEDAGQSVKSLDTISYSFQRGQRNHSVEGRSDGKF